MLKNLARGVSRRLSRLRVVVVRSYTAKPLRHRLSRSDDERLDSALSAAGLQRHTLFTAYKGNARHRKHMAAMMTSFQIDKRWACEAFWPELKEADGICAECPNVGRCERLLAWGLDSDKARAFCPNARLFEQIASAQPVRQTADSPRRP